ELRFLIEHVPAQCRLLIAGRALHGLPVSRLRTQRGLVELGPRELAYSAREIRILLELEGFADPEDGVVEALYQRTEGWPAALSIALCAARASSDSARTLREFDGADRDMVDYVATEVLAELSAAQQTMLLRTSVLDRLSGPLCDALLDRTDSAA